MNRHPEETIQRFIELRAQGRTFDCIAGELAVGLRTLNLAGQIPGAD